MISPDAWQAFGGVLAVIIALGGGVLALQRLGILRPKPAAVPPAPTEEGSDDLGARVADLESRVAVLDERTRKHERSLEGIGRLHGRIDGVAETTGRIEGEITQMNRTLNLMLRHLLGEGES